MKNTLKKCPHRGRAAITEIMLSRAIEAYEKAEAELERVSRQRNKVIDILDDSIADLSALGFPHVARRHQAHLEMLNKKL